MKFFWENARHTWRNRMARREALAGVLFASPFLAGFLCFTAFPILFSIYLSFSRWDPYDPLAHVKFVGLDNYVRAFAHDPLVWTSLYNTFYYVFFLVPLSLLLSLTLAMLLNQRVRGISVFRTIFYMPSVVGGVATAVLWYYIFNPLFGPVNGAIRALNRVIDLTPLAAMELAEPTWLQDPVYAKPVLIVMGLWGAGGAGMLIFLAGLQGVPRHLYEVSELDGAGRWRQFWNVTLPMISPTIYFNFIMGVIGSFQIFMQAYVLGGDQPPAKGGVDNSLLVYVLYLYRKAFVDFEMGYASALAWILFAIILGFTLLVVRSSRMWVYYEGEGPR